MKIKTKLIVNASLMTAVVLAITLISFFSIRFLQKKIIYVTENSTPKQVTNLKLARDIQSCITYLTKASSSDDLEYFEEMKREALNEIGNIELSEKTLLEQNAASTELSKDIKNIAKEIFQSTEDKIKNESSSHEAHKNINEQIIKANEKLKQLDIAIKSLELLNSNSFTMSIAKSEKAAIKLKSIEELRNVVREIQLIAVTMLSSYNKQQFLVLRGKLKTVSARGYKNLFLRSDNHMGGQLRSFITALNELLVKSIKSGNPPTNADNILLKLNDLFQLLDQESILANDVMNLAEEEQQALFANSRKTEEILISNADLLIEASALNNNVNQLFLDGNEKDIELTEKKIKLSFAKIEQLINSINGSLKNIKAKEEEKYLNFTAQSINVVKNSLYSPTGVLETLKSKIRAIEKRKIVFQNLNVITTESAKTVALRVEEASVNQDKSVAAVNQIADKSLSRIYIFGTVAILITILFGYIIYQSIAPKLLKVVTIVKRQRDKLKNSAQSAKKVANGDFDIKLIKSDDEKSELFYRNSNDEISNLVKSISEMQEAQNLLESSFTDMAVSLKKNQMESDQRERLKSGLNTINSIIRVAFNIKTMTESSLSFIVKYVEAVAGSIYILDETERNLTPIAFYSIENNTNLSGMSFMLGEGIIGETAKRKRMMVLNPAPHNYLKISSALGNSDPAYIALFPVMHNDEVFGVCEIAGFKKLHDDDLNFITQALEGVAIALNVEKSKKRVDI